MMKMKHLRPLLLIAGLVILGVAISIMVSQTFSKNVPAVETPVQTEEKRPFTLSSPVINDDGTLPAQYTCGATPLTPPLTIDSAPSNTKSFAVVMYDDKASEDIAHWVVWNIPANTSLLSENVLPEGSLTGTNGFGTANYSPPCPEQGSGEHTYVFQVYALSDDIKLDQTATESRLIAAINGIVIERAKFEVTVRATEGPTAEDSIPAQ